MNADAMTWQEAIRQIAGSKYIMFYGILANPFPLKSAMTKASTNHSNAKLCFMALRVNIQDPTDKICVRHVGLGKLRDMYCTGDA